MKKYLITSNHVVHIDDYEQGELDMVNSYSISEIIEAKSVMEAVDHYIQNVLFYELRTGLPNFESDFIRETRLVDVNNEIPTKSEIEAWKMGLKTLYSNDYLIKVERVKQVKNLSKYYK